MKYSSASDIDSVYAPCVFDDEGMLICRFTWWGRPYGRVKNGEKNFTRARQMNIWGDTLHPVKYLHHIQGGPLVRESPISHLFKRNTKKLIYKSCADTCGAYFKNIVHYTGWPKRKIQTKLMFF